MELKLNLGLETLINLIVFLQNLEYETIALVAVAGLMTPMVFFSLWSLAFSVIIELFWLGVKGGMLLGSLCSIYVGYLRMSAIWYPAKGSEMPAGEISCTLMDVILSILFQAGVKFPSVIWDGLIALGPFRDEAKVTKKRKMVTFSGLVTSKPVVVGPEEMEGIKMEVDAEGDTIMDGGNINEDKLMLNDGGFDFQNLIDGLKHKVQTFGQEELVCVTPNPTTCGTSSVTTRSSSRRQSRGAKEGTKISK